MLSIQKRNPRGRWFIEAQRVGEVVVEIEDVAGGRHTVGGPIGSQHCSISLN